MGNFYGHSRLVCLRSAEGILCYRWLAAPQNAIVLFTDSKLAVKWVKEVAKCGVWLVVAPHLISEHPEHLAATINPSDDGADIRRITDRMFWGNW